MREKRPDRRVNDVQSAGEGAKGRQDQPLGIVDEAGPCYGTVVWASNARLGVPMPGNLAGKRKQGRGFVAKVQSAKGEIFMHFSAKVRGNLGVMVARYPDKTLNRICESLNSLQKGIA